jgi:hypothetical protein
MKRLSLCLITWRYLRRVGKAGPSPRMPLKTEANSNNDVKRGSSLS